MRGKKTAIGSHVTETFSQREQNIQKPRGKIGKIIWILLHNRLSFKCFCVWNVKYLVNVCSQLIHSINNSPDLLC